MLVGFAFLWGASRRWGRYSSLLQRLPSPFTFETRRSERRFCWVREQIDPDRDEVGFATRHDPMTTTSRR